MAERSGRASEDEAVGWRMSDLGAMTGIWAYEASVGLHSLARWGPGSFISSEGTGKVRFCLPGINTDSKTWFWHYGTS